MMFHSPYLKIKMLFLQQDPDPEPDPAAHINADPNPQPCILPRCHLPVLCSDFFLTFVGPPASVLLRT